MQSIALVVHVILAVGVIGLVLMQHGKGADAGAAFGSGASATVFGAGGSASFLTKATTVLAALFFATSIFLFYLAAHRDSAVRSVTDGGSVVQEVAPEELASDLPGVLEAESTPADDSSDLPAAVESAVEGAGDEDMPVPAE